MAQHKFYVPDAEEKEYMALPDENKIKINDVLRSSFSRQVKKQKEPES